MATQPELSGGIRYTPDPTQPAPQGGLAGTVDLSGDAASVLRRMAEGPTQVTLTRSASPPTADQALWIAIRNRTEAIAFPRYAAFVQSVLCAGEADLSAVCGGSAPARLAGHGVPSIEERVGDLLGRPTIYGPAAYELLQLATQAFLVFESGTAIEPPRHGPAGDAMEQEESRLGRPITLDEARDALEQYLSTQVGTVGGRALPYLKRVVEALVPSGAVAEGSPFCDRLLRRRLHCPPMIELLHEFWLEQGALMQTMNAVLLRFQNRRRSAQDPLVNLAIDTLQPMANLLWGRLQEEPRHLSVRRRAHEYRYAYGLTLHGRAVRDVAPVESRTRFIPAFHTLLHKAAQFFAADAKTTEVADGFPLLQALKDLHLVMAEGANNQSAELTLQARAEALVDQYLLSRREMRDFLRGRAGVPQAEGWMPQVETMKRLQGWLPELTIGHFQTLAATGEQVLLSVRLGDWSVKRDQAAAVNWARYWKPELRDYLHSYAAVTGVDLTAEITDTRRADDRYAQPSDHLRRQLAPPAGADAEGPLLAFAPRRIRIA